MGVSPLFRLAHSSQVWFGHPATLHAITVSLPHMKQPLSFADESNERRRTDLRRRSGIDDDDNDGNDDDDDGNDGTRGSMGGLLIGTMGRGIRRDTVSAMRRSFEFMRGSIGGIENAGLNCT